MSSHENDMKTKTENDSESIKVDRLNIPTLKYFWQSSPLATNRKKSIPHFLRNINVFDNFTDYELKKFSHFLHQRNFASEEMVIEEGDSGFGFYLVFNGNVEIFSKRSRIIDGVVDVGQQLVVKISKHEYFGELALLEKQNKRNATAIASGSTTLLAIYNPDVEELIERYPVIGAKFLQGISLIVANRFNNVTVELKALKEKLMELECKLENAEN